MAFASPFRSPLTRLDRYIFRQILLALVAVTVALVALIWLTQSLRFVELIVNRGLSPFVFLRLTALLVPSFVAVILPITTFVVVQFVYQRLAGDRELTVMRAAGQSPLSLAKPTLLLSVAVAALCFWLNVWIVPSSFSAFREYQFEIRNRIAAFLLQEGVFTTISDNLTVYVRHRDQDGTLHGILVDDERDPTNAATIIAQAGRIVPGPLGPRVILFNGARQEVDKKTGRLNLLTFSENVINLASSASGDDAHFRDDSEVSIHELLHPLPGEVMSQDLVKWRAEAYRRLSAPLTAISLRARGPSLRPHRRLPPPWRRRPAADRRRHDRGAHRPRPERQQSRCTQQRLYPAHVGPGDPAGGDRGLAAAAPGAHPRAALRPRPLARARRRRRYRHQHRAKARPDRCSCPAYWRSISAGCS